MLAAVPLQAAPRAVKPGADELILKALGSTASYSAVERVQVFRAGAKPKASKALLSVFAGGKTRREVMVGRKKAPGMIHVRDGREISIYWPSKKKLWRGPSAEETPEAALARLHSVYELSVYSGGRVAKRLTWRVNMRAPGGALRRSLWVDRETGLALKREIYRADESLARRERIVKLELGAEVSPAALRLETPAGTEAAVFNAAPFFPRWSPDGFIPTDSGPSAMSFSDGADTYTIERSPDGKPTIKGDLAEDDAAKVLASLEAGK
jgi:outer membrane lipoprotein-sorting protein